MTAKKSVINQSKQRLAIIGSGVVGSATGKGLLSKGWDTTFVDTSKTVVSELQKKGHNAYLPEDFDYHDIDTFFLSVPSYTEPVQDGIRHVKSSARTLGKWLGNQDHYSLVVIRSTVFPGTTEKTIIPILERYSGKKAGKGFGVCVNPEYLREISSAKDFREPWVVVFGEIDSKSGDLLESIYYWVNCPIFRVKIKEAEMQKFIHNLYNANKISFFNEVRLACNNMGLDANRIFPLVTKSAEAIWNPAYGTHDLGAFGGTCLPKDTSAFYHYYRKSSGISLKLLKAVIDVNNNIKTGLE